MNIVMTPSRVLAEEFKKSSQQDFCDSTHRQAGLRTLAQYVKLNKLYVYS